MYMVSYILGAASCVCVGRRRRSLIFLPSFVQVSGMIYKQRNGKIPVAMVTECSRSHKGATETINEGMSNMKSYDK